MIFSSELLTVNKGLVDLIWWCFTVYVSYRVIRTAVAFLRAVLVYWIAPLVYEPNLDRYKHRWTVVSGGTDGLGKGYTIELARRGLRKFLLIGRNEKKLDEMKSFLETNFGARVQTYLFDFANDDYAVLREHLNGVDIGFVVNSVGVGRDLMEKYGENPDADRAIMKVNCMGSAEFLSMVIPPMERNGGGQIVVMSSILSFNPFPYLGAYCAAKTVMTFLCETIDWEWPTIKVQCLTPSVVATNMTFYKERSILVNTVQNFARQAVGTLGLVNCTTGSFLHEMHILFRHALPWRLLKYLLIPMSNYQRRRAKDMYEARLMEMKQQEQIKRAQA